MAVIENLKPRSYIIQGLFIAIFVLFILRLFYLQVIDDTYKQIADDRGIRKEQVDPDRGQIFDRNGKLIVYNEPSYKLMVVPSQVKDIDTMRFCEIMGIEKEYFIKKMNEARRSSMMRESVFLAQISAQEFGSIQEYLYQFKGFYPTISPVRKYAYPNAAHLLGYVAEVDSNDIKKSDGYYRNADMIGKTGVEKSYEALLRGQKGYKNIVIDRFGREVGPLNDGSEDVAPVAGKNITLTIDIELQAYAEQLLANKRGALVAIEPSTGEILALVSSPGYDPNMLVGSARTKNFAKLVFDKEKPLTNRALNGYYPPGSTFKPVMAALGLDAGTLTPNTGYNCPRGYVMSGHTVACHNHPYPANVELGIGHSCNAYFCYTFRYFIENAHATPAEGLRDFKEKLGRWGIGTRTGVDLPNERNGNVPDPEDYDKIYGKGRWKASNCVTLGIGQDQLILTPLQSANSMAVIANNGFFYTPHVFKYADNSDTIINKFRVKHETGMSDTIFPYIKRGMAGAVNFGTAKVAHIDSIQVCGKTGTAENPHGKSHSWFSCFAPEENPQIAVAIIVENAGWGASYAAPIASLVVEKYINGKIAESRKPLEERMMKSDLIHAGAGIPDAPSDTTKTQQLDQAAILPKD